MNKFVLPAITCAIVVFATTLWPADVPWGGDDVVLIATAARANTAHRLVTVGLGGNVGLPYGPVPTQVYQALLWVSHGDLPAVVRLRAGLTAVAVAVALLWLARSLGWSPWLAVLPLLSPFTWFYSRLLWDNTFALPVGALLVAGYASHLAGRRGLTVAAVAAAVLPFVHPMTLPIVAAVGGHAVGFRRRELARRWRALIVIGIVLTISCGPYLVAVARSRPHRANTASADGYAPLSRPAAMAYPLLAGRLLSGFRFFDGRGPEHGWETTSVGTVARAVSAMAFLLVWVGIGAAAAGSSAYLRRRLGGVGGTIVGLCAVTLVFQALLDGAARVAPYPHYFCGTWAAAVVLLWAGLRVLGPAGGPIGIAYAVACAISTAAFAVDIHRDPAGPVWHGPTLGRQAVGPTFPPVIGRQGP